MRGERTSERQGSETIVNRYVIFMKFYALGQTIINYYLLT